jgi:hypothetical protein
MTAARDRLSLLLHVSNHGYGHAARAGILAAALLERPDVFALAIAAPATYGRFFAAALADPRCALVDVSTDLGIPLRPGELVPEPRYVAARLDEWVAAWHSILARHEALLAGRRIDAIVADASPLGCALAARLGCPAIVVSNFEWHAQFAGLGLAGSAVDAVGEAYARAAAYLRYPLHLPSEALARVPTADVPACARTAAVDASEALRRSLPGPRLFVSLGGLIDLAAPIALPRFAGTAIFTQGLRIEAPRAARVVDLSAGFADTLPYLGAADLVVTKGGWSTVAEAAVARTPLLLIRRPGVPEDRHIIAGVERLGLGRGCDLEVLPDAIEGEISRGLAPTPGLPNDPAAVAEACLDFVS